MRILALCLLLCGCGGNWVNMTCADTVTMSIIHWEYTADPVTKCAALGSNVQERGACIRCNSSQPSFTTCVLYAEKPSVATDMTIGHETREAFGCRAGKYL